MESRRNLAAFHDSALAKGLLPVLSLSLRKGVSKKKDAGSQLLGRKRIPPVGGIRT